MGLESRDIKRQPTVYMEIEVCLLNKYKTPSPEIEAICSLSPLLHAPQRGSPIKTELGRRKDGWRRHLRKKLSEESTPTTLGFRRDSFK